MFVPLSGTKPYEGDIFPPYTVKMQTKGGLVHCASAQFCLNVVKRHHFGPVGFNKGWKKYFKSN